MSWIKMRTNLRTAPKVVRLASALKADRLRIIGGLWAVWSIFDEHSVDGTLEGYTLAALDEDLGWRGFSAALEDVRWLEQTEDGLILPEFDEHNGASAKRRATDSKRKSEGREADKSYGGSWNTDGQSGGQMSASDADKKQTRVEQDKKKTSSSGARGAKRCPPDFEVTDDLVAWAASETPGVNVERETAKFRDYTFGTAKSDWTATWRNWMRSAAEKKGGGANGSDMFAGMR